MKLTRMQWSWSRVAILCRVSGGLAWQVCRISFARRAVLRMTFKASSWAGKEPEVGRG